MKKKEQVLIPSFSNLSLFSVLAVSLQVKEDITWFEKDKHVSITNQYTY